LGVDALLSWRFHVENLGCLKSGDFEVKPLTLLCGPNNTGKTWVMYALYGFLSDTIRSWPLPEIDQVIENIRQTNGIYSWDFGGWLETHADELLQAINKEMKRRLPEILNAPDAIFSNSQFIWKIERETFIRSGIERNIFFQLNIFKQHVFDLYKSANQSTLKIVLQAEDVPNLASYLSRVLLDELMGLGTRRQRCFLIPAERNGLNLFFRELAYSRTALLHPSSRVNLDTSDISKYAEPIADYIDFLNEAPRRVNEQSAAQYISLSEEIESIVGGIYHVDLDGNTSFTPIHSDLSLDLNLSSSTVKSLFGLWFYLKHQAKVGEIIVIDEPELNLHPANQRALARLLVRLVNAGLRVVISTHSDYIVREINSLIMLNRPHRGREHLMQRYGYHEEEALNPAKVAGYVFDGSSIKAMDITEDEGILASTFDKIIDELNETSDGIYYTYRGMADEEAE
jgi:predicted ATP-dependent endonuclease of OLD family